MTSPELDRLERLMDAVESDLEQEVLDPILIRAGLMWVCQAEWDEGECWQRNPEGTDACIDCGAIRPRQPA